MKQMMVNHTSQINVMQNILMATDKNHVGQNQRIFQPRPNQEWQKKYYPQEQIPPNQLESNNMVDEVPPYYRPCEEFHEESTCPKFCYIMKQEQMEVNNFVGYPRYPDYINNKRHVHPISKEKWKQTREYNQEKDNATKIFGEKPTPEHIIEKYKGMVYQIKKNVIPTKSNQHIPKVKISPPIDLNIDLGNWLSSAKNPIPVIEIPKIPSQRDFHENLGGT